MPTKMFTHWIISPTWTASVEYPILRNFEWEKTDLNGLLLNRCHFFFFKSLVRLLEPQLIATVANRGSALNTNIVRCIS